MARNANGSPTGEKRRISDSAQKGRKSSTGQRSPRGAVTSEQASLLRSKGLSVPKRKAQATEVIERLAKLNWRPDHHTHELADWYANGGEARVHQSSGRNNRSGKGKGLKKLAPTNEQKDTIHSYGLPIPPNRHNAHRAIQCLESKGWQVDDAVIRKVYELCGRKNEGKRIVQAMCES